MKHKPAQKHDDTKALELAHRLGASAVDADVIQPDQFIGDWIEKRCPKCGSQMLGNKFGDEWCSFSKCGYGCEYVYKELGQNAA